jgi:hypothetical protein
MGTPTAGVEYLNCNRMGAKNLNGLPYSLAQSYFSTLNYSGGYTCDWIVNGANALGITSVEIDVLQKRISPPQMEKIKSLTWALGYLNPIIEKTLVSNSLPSDFIRELKFQITIYADRGMKCHGYAKGINDRTYEAGDYYEKSYETFDAFYIPSRWEKFISKIKFWSFYWRFKLFRRIEILRPTIRYTKRLDPNQEFKL